MDHRAARSAIRKLTAGDGLLQLSLSGQQDLAEISPPGFPGERLVACRNPVLATDLLAPLSRRGITLSSSQVYRLVADRPERLSLKILMALLDNLDCTMEELIEPVAAAGQARAAGGQAGVGELRPKRARIAPADE